MDKPAKGRRGGLTFLPNKQPPNLTRTTAAMAFSCPVNSASAPSWCLIYAKTLFGLSGWSDKESCYRRTEWLNVPLWCNRVEAKRKQGFRESKHTTRNIWKAICADWAERCLALGFSADPAGVGPSGRLRLRHLRSLCLSRFTDDRKFCFGSEFHQPAVTWRSVTVVIITTLSLRDKDFSVDCRFRAWLKYEIIMWRKGNMHLLDLITHIKLSTVY